MGEQKVKSHKNFKHDRKFFRNLNFATAPCSEDESEYGNGAYKKNKVSRVSLLQIFLF